MGWFLFLLDRLDRSEDFRLEEKESSHESTFGVNTRDSKLLVTVLAHTCVVGEVGECHKIHPSSDAKTAKLLCWMHMSSFLGMFLSSHKITTRTNRLRVQLA